MRRSCASAIPADRFYVIESEQVEETPFSHEADVHVLTMQGADYFGEVGLLATRTARVRTVSEVRVISLDGAEFQALVDVSESNATQLGRLVDNWIRSELSQRTCSGAKSRDSQPIQAAIRRAAATCERGPYYQHKGAKPRNELQR